MPAHRTPSGVQEARSRASIGDVASALSSVGSALVTAAADQRAYRLRRPSQVRVRYFWGARSYIDLSPVILSFDWDESENQAARVFTLTLDDFAGRLGDLRVIRNGGVVVAEYLTADRWVEWFRGDVIVNAGQHTATEAVKTLTIHDPLRLLHRNRGNWTFPKGRTATQSIRALAARARLPIGSFEDTRVSLPGFTYSGSMFDAALFLLAHTLRRTGRRYLLEFDAGKLHLRRYVRPVWDWDFDYVISEAQGQSSIEEVVTKWVLRGQTQSLDTAVSKRDTAGPRWHVVEVANQFSVRKGSRDAAQVAIFDSQDAAIEYVRKAWVDSPNGGTGVVHLQGGGKQEIDPPLKGRAAREGAGAQLIERETSGVALANQKILEQYGVIQDVFDVGAGGGDPRAVRRAARQRVSRSAQPVRTHSVVLPFDAFTLRRLHPVKIDKHEPVSGLYGTYYVSALAGHLGAEGASMQVSLTSSPEFLVHQGQGEFIQVATDPFFDGAGEFPGGPIGSYPGDASPIQTRARWMAVAAVGAGLPAELPVMASLVETGGRLENLDYGDRDSVGLFQMRLQYWNKGKYVGYPSLPALQLQWFIDQALATQAKYGFRPGEPARFGEWCQAIERSAYPERYQPQLGPARALLGLEVVSVQ